MVTRAFTSDNINLSHPIFLAAVILGALIGLIVWQSKHIKELTETTVLLKELRKRQRYVARRYLAVDPGYPETGPVTWILG